MLFYSKDLLELQAGLFNVPKNERITKELLELFDLTEKADEYSRKLSGGMREDCSLQRQWFINHQ